MQGVVQEASYPTCIIGLECPDRFAKMFNSKQLKLTPPNLPNMRPDDDPMPSYGSLGLNLGLGSLSGRIGFGGPPNGDRGVGSGELSAQLKTPASSPFFQPAAHDGGVEGGGGGGPRVASFLMQPRSLHALRHDSGPDGGGGYGGDRHHKHHQQQQQPPYGHHRQPHHQQAERGAVGHGSASDFASMLGRPGALTRHHPTSRNSSSSSNASPTPSAGSTGLKRKTPDDGKPGSGGKAAPEDDKVINLDDDEIIEVKVEGQPGGSGLQGGGGKRASFRDNYDDSGADGAAAGSRVALFEDDDGMGRMEEHMTEEEDMDDDPGRAGSKEDDNYWDTRDQYAPRQQNHGRHQADNSSPSIDLRRSNASDNQHLRYERERDRWAAQRGTDDKDTNGVVGPDGKGSRRGGSPQHDDGEREDETPPPEGTAGVDDGRGGPGGMAVIEDGMMGKEGSMEPETQWKEGSMEPGWKEGSIELAGACGGAGFLMMGRSLEEMRRDPPVAPDVAAVSAKFMELTDRIKAKVQQIIGVFELSFFVLFFHALLRTNDRSMRSMRFSFNDRRYQTFSNETVAQLDAHGQLLQNRGRSLNERKRETKEHYGMFFQQRFGSEEPKERSVVKEERNGNGIGDNNHGGEQARGVGEDCSPGREGGGVDNVGECGDVGEEEVSGSQTLL
ncbi:hypothetical protein HK101_004099 [Irineochytrium annulatum]|nr:hypothetical protein HK101_004099 [Irineochytrium annulatum]